MVRSLQQLLNIYIDTMNKAKNSKKSRGCGRCIICYLKSIGEYENYK